MTSCWSNTLYVCIYSYKEVLENHDDCRSTYHMDLVVGQCDVHLIAYQEDSKVDQCCVEWITGQNDREADTILCYLCTLSAAVFTYQATDP